MNERDSHDKRGKRVAEQSLARRSHRDPCTRPITGRSRLRGVSAAALALIQSAKLGMTTRRPDIMPRYAASATACGLVCTKLIALERSRDMPAAAWKPVGTGPGQSAVTDTPFDASSCDSASLNEST